MQKLKPEEIWFCELMEADTCVRPLLLARWKKADPDLAGRVEALWQRFLAPECDEEIILPFIPGGELSSQ